MPAVLAESLTASKALIFRITHRRNLAWILDNGLQCRNSAMQDPDFVSIGNPDLIAKRASRDVPLPPGGTLSDYLPFYFTPYSPMMFNIHTGFGGMMQLANDEILVLVSSIHKVVEASIPFVFTDRHAYLKAANYYNDLAQIEAVDYPLLRSRDFSQDPNDPEKLERYQAEALVYQALPPDSLLGVICYSSEVLAEIESEVAQRNIPLKTFARPGWYFI